jgi:hypothetical protein
MMRTSYFVVLASLAVSASTACTLTQSEEDSNQRAKLEVDAGLEPDSGVDGTDPYGCREDESDREPGSRPCRDVLDAGPPEPPDAAPGDAPCSGDREPLDAGPFETDAGPYPADAGPTGPDAGLFRH